MRQGQEREGDREWIRGGLVRDFEKEELDGEANRMYSVLLLLFFCAKRKCNTRVKEGKRVRSEMMECAFPVPSSTPLLFHSLFSFVLLLLRPKSEQWKEDERDAKREGQKKKNIRLSAWIRLLAGNAHPCHKTSSSSSSCLAHFSLLQSCLSLLRSCSVRFFFDIVVFFFFFFAFLALDSGLIWQSD